MQTSRIAVIALALGALLPAAYAQAPATPGAPLTPAAPAARQANHVTGQVTAVANGSYTVTPRRDPTPVTFSLSPDADVVRTALGALTDVQVGSPVRVDGTVSADGTSITAERLTVLASLPTHGEGVGKVKPNGKHVIGTVASVSPLKVTAGDGAQVAVDTTTAPRVMVQTAAALSDIVVGTRVQVTLNRHGEAREVVILPAGRGRRAGRRFVKSNIRGRGMMRHAPPFFAALTRQPPSPKSLPA